jgi:hypothetical protein
VLSSGPSGSGVVWQVCMGLFSYVWLSWDETGCGAVSFGR